MRQMPVRASCAPTHVWRRPCRAGMRESSPHAATGANSRQLRICESASSANPANRRSASRGRNLPSSVRPALRAASEIYAIAAAANGAAKNASAALKVSGCSSLMANAPIPGAASDLKMNSVDPAP